MPTADIELKGPVSYEPSAIFSRDYYEIDYDVKLSNGMNLQRDLVWTLTQKQALIESMLKGLSLPEFHVVLYKSAAAERGDTRTTVFKIIDGKQRLSTIQQFINNEFMFEWNGISYYFADFDKDTKFIITNYHMHFKIVYEYDDRRLTDKQLVDWFNMVNFSGTQQDAAHMANLQNSLKV
jgi:hypothetical protein